MKLCWLTDIHFNFINVGQIDRFLYTIHDYDPESILISGDIGESNSVVEYLKLFNDRFSVPIFFVLGNHDYYHGSFTQVHANVTKVVEESSNLYWLDNSNVIMLNKNTSIIGHSSWADGGFGDYQRSELMLNDYILINDFSAMNKAERLYKMREIALKASDHLDAILPKALDQSNHVICLTHVPPFEEACWHKGSISHDNWLPHFACKAVGDVLRKYMSQYSEKRMTVLCGHTHSDGFTQILKNLDVYTGKAIYGAPEIQQFANLTG